jgi:hypothetical protein
VIEKYITCIFCSIDGKCNFIFWAATMKINQNNFTVTIEVNCRVIHTSATKCSYENVLVVTVNQSGLKSNDDGKC